MQQPNQTASIPDCLLVPHYRLALTKPRIVLPLRIFLVSELLVALTAGKDEEECVGRARDEGEEVGIVDAKDVMERQAAREAKVMDEGCHYLRVVF